MILGQPINVHLTHIAVLQYSTWSTVLIAPFAKLFFWENVLSQKKVLYVILSYLYTANINW